MSVRCFAGEHEGTRGEQARASRWREASVVAVTLPGFAKSGLNGNARRSLRETCP
jgi:hypothetical protein